MTSESSETILWRGSPSQWTNFGAYLGAFLLAAVVVCAAWYTPPASRNLVLIALVLPVLWAFARWIGTRCHVYEVTTERVKVTEGLFSRRSNELELYRVRDYSIVEPFWLRLIGVGDILLVTADRTSPEVRLRAVPRAASLKDQIRTHTERMRQQRGVRDLELDPPAAPPPPA